MPVCRKEGYGSARHPSTLSSTLMRRRGAQSFQVVNDLKHRIVKGVGGFLMAEDVRLLNDRLTETPKGEARLQIEDDKPQQRFIGCVRDTDFKNQIGIGGRRDKFILSRALHGCVELVIRAVSSADGSGNDVSRHIGDEDLFRACNL